MNAKWVLVAVVILSGMGNQTEGAILHPGDIIVADEGFGLESDGNDGAIFKVDPQTGERTILSGRGVGSGPELFNPLGVAIAPSGQVLVTDTAVPAGGGTRVGVIYAIDPATGNRTEVSGPTQGVGPQFGGTGVGNLHGIDIDESGAAIVAGRLSPGEGAIFRVDLTTGNRSVVTSPANRPGDYLMFATGLDIGPDGTVFVADERLSRLWSIDPTTGEQTLLGQFIANSPRGIVLSEDSTQVYVGDPGHGIAGVDVMTGNVEIISDGAVGIGPDSFAYGVARERSGSLLASGGESLFGSASVLRIEIATGDRVAVTGLGAGVGPEMISPRLLTIVAVPEPSTLSLLCLALAGFAYRRIASLVRRDR